MVEETIDIGERFAMITGQLEDALSITIEGQRSGLSQDEAKVLVQLLQQHIANILATCRQITFS